MIVSKVLILYLLSFTAELLCERVFVKSGAGTVWYTHRLSKIFKFVCSEVAYCWTLLAGVQTRSKLFLRSRWRGQRAMFRQDGVVFQHPRSVDASWAPLSDHQSGFNSITFRWLKSNYSSFQMVSPTIWRYLDSSRSETELPGVNNVRSGRQDWTQNAGRQASSSKRLY